MSNVPIYVNKATVYWSLDRGFGACNGVPVAFCHKRHIHWMDLSGTMQKTGDVRIIFKRDLFTGKLTGWERLAR